MTLNVVIDHNLSLKKGTNSQSSCRKMYAYSWNLAIPLGPFPASDLKIFSKYLKEGIHSAEIIS